MNPDRIPLPVPVLTRHNLDGFDPAGAAAIGAVLLVDKPRGWTSFDVVAKTRGLLRVKKIGHTGTLDPMATGLLLLCLGRATRLADTLQAEQKEYVGAMVLGTETDTDDAEGKIAGEFPTGHITPPMVMAATETLTGTQNQMPPAFSARKVGGQRMYRLARRGQSVDAPPREITVHTFEITELELPLIRFRIVCSKGTYIRAIARDLGRALGSGAHLTELRRTLSGKYSVGDAVGMEELAAFADRLRRGIQEQTAGPDNEDI